MQRRRDSEISTEKTKKLSSLRVSLRLCVSASNVSSPQSLLPQVEPLLDFLPVHDVPPGGQIIRAAVLILQVIRVLPDIDTHDWGFAFHHRAVLIGGGIDVEFTTGFDQPRPARSEAREARLV